MKSRKDRVIEAHTKMIPPFTLDETLTFFCPQENVDALDHPDIQELHNFMLSQYEPPVGGKKAVMLMLPCTKVKPYCLSQEHQAINGYLLEKGFRPVEEAVYPAELEEALCPDADRLLLNNKVWARRELFVHRFVMSEPMALVPYEYLYTFMGKPSLTARYDDPGLFEHRGTAVCPWRPDFSGIKSSRGYRWGDNEKEAYVKMHNSMVSLIGAALYRLRDYYQARLAYVSPKLTHRSFMTSIEEKRRAGLTQSKRTAEGLLYLEGVNDHYPGLVHCVPDEDDIRVILERLSDRLPGRSMTQVKGYFATGGGGVTPLILPETLDILGRHLDSL